MSDLLNRLLYGVVVCAPTVLLYGVVGCAPTVLAVATHRGCVQSCR
jgi:hypothetical protein